MDKERDEELLSEFLIKLYELDKELREFVGYKSK
jgi:hypothetical protein